MAYVNVPKDILRIKNKSFFGLGKRELVSIAIAGFLGYSIYFYLKNFLGINALYISIGLGLPIIFAGFYEDNGITIEKKLLYILKFYFSSQIRVYKSNNFYKRINNQVVINKKIKKVLKKRG